MTESMATGWYCMQGGATGQQTGPLTWEQLYGLRASGSLQPSDLVWHPTMPQWMPAAQIPGLFPEATQPPVAQQPPYQQPPYQQPAYQQGAQPAWTGQAGYQAPAPKRSRLWLWLGPLIALVLIGIGLGVFFGLFFNKDDVGKADPSIPLDSLYGTWDGTLKYESLKIDEKGMSAAEAAALKKLQDRDIPFTLELSGTGANNNSATFTIDYSAVDSTLRTVSEDMDFTYKDGKLTFEPEASADRVIAAAKVRGGYLVIDGIMRFKAPSHSGKAAWTVKID